MHFLTLRLLRDTKRVGIAPNRTKVMSVASVAVRRGDAAGFLSVAAGVHSPGRSRTSGARGRG